MDVILWNTGPRINDFAMYRTLGPYKLAHTVRSAGYTAQVIDHIAWMTADELYTSTIKYITTDTVCLGISTTFLVGPKAHIPEHVVQVVNRLATEFPNVKIVVGGPYTREIQQRAASLVKLYAAFLHYSEDTFLEVIKFLKNDGKMPPFQFETWKNKNVYVFNKPADEKFDIETDAYRFVEQDHIMPGETLPLEISRGCIFKCKFCNHLMLGRGKLDYLRDFELVKEELMQNYEKWGVTNYYIICDTFNDTEFKMKAWHAMVASLPFKIKYTSYLRADLLDKFPDVPYMLQEAGLIAGFHGIESLGESASMLIGKGWSGKSAREFIPRLTHDIWKSKVKLTLSFIVGLPGDTRESLVDTAHWFVDNDLYNINWSSLGLSKDLPGRNASEFERNAEQYGFTFPKATIPYSSGNTVWQTDYWNCNQADAFIKDTLVRITNPSNARHGSWTLLQLMQYGVTEDWFEKDKIRVVNAELNLAHRASNWLKAYLARLNGTPLTF